LKFSLTYKIPEASVAEKVKPKKFITYDRYGGRFSNQLFQLGAAAAAAKAFDRTLILPVEKRVVDFTGIYDKVPFWDLSLMEEKFNIIRSHEYSTNKLMVPKRCQIDIRELFKKKIIPENCTVVSLGGATSQLFCHKQRFCGTAKDQRYAYAFYQSLRLAPKYQKIIDDYPVYDVGLHSRSFMGSNDPKLCEKKGMEVLRHHLKTINDKTRKMLELSCKTREGKNFKELAKMYNKTIENSIYGIDYPQFTVPGASHKFERFKTGVSNHRVEYWGFSPSRIELYNIVQILIEQRILSKSKFFFGNIYSSLSLAICSIRGEERKWESNICGLILHPEEEKIKLKKYWKSVLPPKPLDY
jgi:hypothetical protein